MRHAILIHAHRFPEQFGRLCCALEHPSFDIWANIDSKAEIEPFRAVAPSVNFVRKRINVRWGHWSQVEATFNSLEEIAESGQEYGYVIFISGQDYPVRPLDEIAEYLERHNGQEFIAGIVPENDPGKRRTWERRYTKRWLLMDSYRDLSIFLSKKILHLLPGQKKPYPIYKGSQWWNLSMNCVRYLLDYRHRNPALIRSYRHSLCADEMFFQSTLMASPLAGRLVNNNFRYIDWSAYHYPKVLMAGDYEAIIESGAWFCRKVEMDADPALFDMLDAHIGAASGRDGNSTDHITAGNAPNGNEPHS